MDIDWACELVVQVNGHWREQLRPRYGLSDDEHFWEPDLRKDRSRPTRWRRWCCTSTARCCTTAAEVALLRDLYANR